MFASPHCNPLYFGTASTWWVCAIPEQKRLDKFFFNCFAFINWPKAGREICVWVGVPYFQIRNVAITSCFQLTFFLIGKSSCSFLGYCRGVRHSEAEKCCFIHKVIWNFRKKPHKYYNNYSTWNYRRETSCDLINLWYQVDALFSMIFHSKL